MPEPNQQGSQTASAKPQSAPAGDQKISRPIAFDGQAVRRDQFFLAIASAILTRQQGRSPHALAKECKDYTDAFLTALDAPTGA